MYEQTFQVLRHPFPYNIPNPRTFAGVPGNTEPYAAHPDAPCIQKFWRFEETPVPRSINSDMNRNMRNKPTLTLLTGETIEATKNKGKEVNT